MCENGPFRVPIGELLMYSKVKSKIRNIFFTGILVTVPLALTIFLFQFLFIKLDGFLNPVVKEILMRLGLPLNPEFRIPGLGLVAMILVIFIARLFARNIVGRKLVELGEGILVKIPLFKNIYVGAKQVIETFGASENNTLRRVVLVEYPREGIYSLAFVTSENQGEV